MAYSLYFGGKSKSSSCHWPGGFGRGLHALSFNSVSNLASPWLPPSAQSLNHISMKTDPPCPISVSLFRVSTHWAVEISLEEICQHITRDNTEVTKTINSHPVISILNLFPVALQCGRFRPSQSAHGFLHHPEWEVVTVGSWRSCELSCSQIRHLEAFFRSQCFIKSKLAS